MLIYNVGNYAVFPLDNDDEPLIVPCTLSSFFLANETCQSQSVATNLLNLSHSFFRTWRNRNSVQNSLLPLHFLQ